MKEKLKEAMEEEGSEMRSNSNAAPMSVGFSIDETIYSWSQ